MTTDERSAVLATQWIEAWIRIDMDWLRQNLSSDCVHVSRTGRLEGRDHYLAVVEPIARRSVIELKILDAVATGNQAAVMFL